jgi:putative flippase GtrA
MRLRDTVSRRRGLPAMRVSRFILTGGICAVINNILVIAFTRFGFGCVAASILAFGPVLCVGYILHASFTFTASPTRTSFAKYTVTMAANFPLWITAIFILSNISHLRMELAAPTTTALLFLWNYLSAKWAFLVVGEITAGAPLKK